MTAILLNQLFHSEGVIVRMLWDICVNLTKPVTSTSELFTKDFDAVSHYRSASFLRYDLPIAVADGNHYCLPHYRFGIVVNHTSSRRQGCAFWRDAATGDSTTGGHLFYAGDDPDDGYKSCKDNVQFSCWKDWTCCELDWSRAIEKQKICRHLHHNEYLVDYGRLDIVALVYTRFASADPTTPNIMHKYATYIRSAFKLSLPIVELNLPMEFDTSMKFWGTHDINFSHKNSPFSEPPTGNVEIRAQMH